MTRAGAPSLFDETTEFPLSYGVVCLTIFAVGFGLVHLGHWVRARK